MPTEYGEHGAGLGIPDAGRVIARGGDNLAAVGTEFGAGEVGLVSLQNDAR
jgi:hypothetical protein